MEFKPGDILYRKESDKNALYYVVKKYMRGSYWISGGFLIIANFRSTTDYDLNYLPVAYSDNYIVVDLNNYEIKDLFLAKVKRTLEENLGKNGDVDNLTYIEVLADLKKYENNGIVAAE